MIRCVNVMHRIRRLRRDAKDIAFKVGGGRLGPKRSRTFSYEFVRQYIEDFVVRLRVGHIELYDVSTGEKLNEASLVEKVLESGASAEVDTVAEEPKVASKKAEKKAAPKEKATEETASKETAPKEEAPAKKAVKKSAPKKVAARKKTSSSKSTKKATKKKASASKSE